MSIFHKVGLLTHQPEASLSKDSIFPKKVTEHKLPPFEVVRAASQSNSEAMIAVLEHYGEYIKTLSIRKVYDGNGRAMFFIDDSLRKRLEIALALAISKFNIL